MHTTSRNPLQVHPRFFGETLRGILVEFFFFAVVQG